MLKRLGLCVLLVWAIVAGYVHPSAAQDSAASDGETSPLTLELIMSDPDWLGNPPQNPYWADDSASFYYAVKRQGEERRDVVEMSLAGEVLRTIENEDRGQIDVAGGELSLDRKLKVYSRQGDLYVKELESGKLRQLTRTAAREWNPRFLADGDRVSYRRGNEGHTVLVRDLTSGLESQPFDLRLADDPGDEEEESDYLQEQQARLFEIVRLRKERQDREREENREEQAADPTRPDLPWYLGTKIEIQRSSLSPTGQWMVLAVIAKKRDEGKADQMPDYVSKTGYVEVDEVRVKVGTANEVGEELWLLDRESHTKTVLDLKALPGIQEDPLKELREQARLRKEEARKAKGEDEDEDETDENEEDEDEDPTGDDESEGESDEKRGEDTGKDDPEVRPIRCSNILWSEDGRRVVVQCFSLDNKDRWIAEIDLQGKSLIALERITDQAWINWRYRDLGWLRDNETLYYLSEESGYSHLYTRSLAKTKKSAKRALTQGEFVVSQPELTRDGKFLYFTANRDHPGIYEIYRVSLASEKIEKLTNLGGQNSAVLSPDQGYLLIRHSKPRRPWELYLQKAKPGRTATQVTYTTSDAFLSHSWIEPEVVSIPSSHVNRPIYSRVYSPPDTRGAAEKRPAVVFVHGAGYLQNAHQGWSSYFREFMFHTFLVQRGYVVLDMDYRASAGYGRDWRTAIYRHMGSVEIEDLEDGVAWLVRHRNVDPERVGVYGGSYGGFLTLMALFQKPGLFAAGAALRPVTDWAHYNHPYTSNILNRPDLDPEAYERSSPIELATGLKDHLLLCHGMLDDNVFFQDTVRLAQRLIELKKENWETAIYPIERHGFREPTSWLDEYRRIFKLFEEHVRNE